MSLDADRIVERRRLRRKVTFWRVFAVVVVILAVVGIGVAITDNTEALGGGVSGSIARIKIDGLIQSDQQRVEGLERLGKSAAKAVIVHINSPGGTTAGSEELHDALIRLKAQKPIVIVIDGLAASGGYIAALGGDRIIARETSLVGSIGVLFQYPNVYELLNTVGVKIESVKSSPLKAAPSGYEPTSPEARAAIESIVLDSYAWFKTMVKDRRQMDDAQLERVSDGRVFTGRQAMGLKLVDELGDEKAAVTWLATDRKIDPKTPVRDYKLRERLSDFSFLRLATVSVLDSVGLGTVARRFESLGSLQAIERLNLDGLLALWHPQSN